jgi:AcrR family transcriptional regulator
VAQSTGNRRRRGADAAEQTLSREHLGATALRIVDREGVDALSMRRLADELGVGTMTLYGYVRSKRELLDAAIDAAAADFDAPPAEGTPRERARAFLLAVVAWLERHPALVEIRGEEPIVRPAAFRISEIGMGILLDAGFGEEEAALAFRLFFAYVFGAALIGPRPAERSAPTSSRAAIATLSPEEFPSLLAAAPQLMEAFGGGPEGDAYAIERILDGLEQRLR